MPHPRKLFLLDGIGAVVTATLLAGVLAPFESAFGMPAHAVRVLAAVAAGFAVYSLVCYFKFPAKWRPLLRGIAVANLSYCAATLVLVVLYRAEVTLLGVAYFAAEVLVVAPLVIYELGAARRHADH